MRLQDLKDMPLFYKKNAKVLGKVIRAVMGDDFSLLYLVIELSDGTSGMVERKHLKFSKDAVMIDNPESIKSYAHGEELTIYHKKVGDVVYSNKGQELGVISDFILSPESKQIRAVEVSAGLLLDLVEGRAEIPLDQVCWKSETSLLVEDLGGELS